MKQAVTFFFIVTFLNHDISAQMSNPVKRFLSGFFAPVYMTTTNIEVEKVDLSQKKQEKIVIPRGTFYSVLHEEGDTLFFEITSRLKKEKCDSLRCIFEAMPSYRKYKEFNLEPTHKKYKKSIVRDTTYKIPYGLFSLNKPKPINYVFKQGVTIGTLFLPIKIRPERVVDGVEFNREFSTDISVGPFMGYKYHIGDYFNQYIKFGIFAGPSLININPSNTLPTDSIVSNVLGLSLGGGIVGEFKKVQAGIVFGWDYVSGDVAQKWIYDRKLWLSIGIGFNFFQDRE